MAIAVGDVLNHNGAAKTVCIMTAQTANTGVPAGGAAGIPGYPTGPYATKDDGHSYARLDALYSTLLIRTIGASTGALTAVFTLWGYNPLAQDWFPIKVNGAAAVTGTNKVQYAEKFQNLGHYSRLFLELESIGGTTPQFEAFLVTGRGGTAVA